MKKVFSALVLTSFFAVLLVPVITSAAGTTGYADCQSSCSSPVSYCNCGGLANGETIGATPMYCYNGARFSNNSDGLAACQNAAGGTTSGGSVSTFPGLLNKLRTLSNYIFDGLIVIAGIFLVIAGYFFVTGGGEPEKVNKARQMLINALIGVAIAVAAKGLVMLVQNIVQ